LEGRLVTYDLFGGKGDVGGGFVKKCPFCAEEIQDDAIKCRYCNEFLDDAHRQQQKWYYRTYWVVIAILCIGPLALPLVWINPRYGRVTKIVVTVIVLIASWYLYVKMREAWDSLQNMVRQLE
jgi:hypothetical protein